MSYSRWSHSSWYSFWAASEVTSMEDEILALWYSLDTCLEYTYKECVELLRLTDNDRCNRIRWRYGCNGDEASEAMEIVMQFVDDVRKNYDRRGSD